MQAKQIKVLLWILLLKLAASISDDFIFNGFRGANLSLDGIASITSNGLLMLTNGTRQMKGHAFCPIPLYFRERPAGNIFSFSTTFVFAIMSEYAELSGHGIAFVISPTKDLSQSLPSHYLGLFNSSNIGNPLNHILAVELDTLQSNEFQDIDDDHVGIDINSLKSNTSQHAAYFDKTSGKFTNLSLISGKPMQVWVDYDGTEMQLNVTLSPVEIPKADQPLLSLIVNLSDILVDSMYVGFSAATGSIHTSHYILGWSFKMNGIAKALTFSQLPSLPRVAFKDRPRYLTIWLPAVVSAVILISIAVIIFIVRRRMKFAELLEDWELGYGPHRFSYKDLFRATKGFKDKELLGFGGFGRVYKGVLPTSKIEVAVKKVSHESRQGMKEFVAEIVSLGRLRHRNLVQLLGYCRRKGELLLVYDYMPNGSLDKFLYGQDKPTLGWAHRLQIIKGVASGLLYLHEDWEQVVIHRDIKANNVLLDSEMNGRLGDFGLARLYDHGTDPQTTHVVGTMGYLAPELSRAGKATTITDVFAFGAFALEVVCGRRPIEPKSEVEQTVLVDWVVDTWQRGTILETKDPRLGEDYVAHEVELVLKVGLLCSHPLPLMRPTMRQVVQILDGDMPLPQLSELPHRYLSYSLMALLQSDGFDEYVMSNCISMPVASFYSTRSATRRSESVVEL